MMLTPQQDVRPFEENECPKKEMSLTHIPSNFQLPNPNTPTSVFQIRTSHIGLPRNIQELKIPSLIKPTTTSNW
ncbi:hypothetical protein SOVF_114610 [Spinacia oleracea]|nr:hypothetical protein SOVF_114610 [Spinacia oleracea]